jgi:type II secretory pathway predicted ATPase ExeA
MRHNDGVGGEKYKVQKVVALLIALVCVGAGVALWALRDNKAAAYWIGGLGTLVAILTPSFDYLVSKVRARERDRIDAGAATLRESLIEQWEGEINRRVGHPYPLPVPFTVTRQAKEVMDGWKAIRGDAKAVALPMKGKFEDIAAVFTQPGMPQRLVILGKPGSGKSMIAQWLMLKLLKPIEETDGKEGKKEDRVPFFLPLATWNPATPLEDWAAAQMIETYPALGETFLAPDGQERTLARELVAKHRVLMILDGLDEMAPENQGRALDRLSDAVMGGLCMVLTCRTEAYQQIVQRSLKGPLYGTPVIELSPLPMSAVRAYLREDRSQADGRWDELLRHLAKEPKGAAATALSTPLAVWLAHTVYANTKARPPENAAAGSGAEQPQRPTGPSELIHEDSVDKIMHRLLGGLVPAAYAAPVENYPEREAPEGSKIYNQMVSIAKRTSDQKETPLDIDWWRLHEFCPRVVIGLQVGLIVGPLLGIAVGLAVTVKAGHAAGLIFGVALGIVTGTLAGITCARPQEEPRTVNFGFTGNRLSPGRLTRCLAVGLAVGVTFAYAADHRGGLESGLITALIVGPVAAWAAIKAFGPAPGITTGITAAISIGLAAGLASDRPSWPVAGPVAGLVFLIGAWVFIGAYDKAETKLAVNPHSLLKQDREGCMVVGLTAGAVFGVLYGLALGLEVGGIAILALTIVVTLTVSLWGTFMLARLWLAARCGLPLQVMSFLHEAHERGVLRQNGPHYQFRHAMLHERLAGHPIVVSSPAARPAEDHAVAGNPQTEPQAAVT